MGNPWGKFFWQDWESDPALKLCGLAAQGLWMRMLCIAATHEPIGYVAVAGKPLDATALARLTGAAEGEVASLLGELEETGVFSRDAKGRIYSRRMIRDARATAEARKNGKKGGNPSLSKEKDKSIGDNPMVKGGDKTHKPEARYQKEKEEVTASDDAAHLAFDGQVIRLNELDFKRWQRGFPALDLPAVLQARDDWLTSDADEATKKKWFISTSNYLANLQQKATAAAVREERAAEMPC